MSETFEPLPAPSSSRVATGRKTTWSSMRTWLHVARNWFLAGLDGQHPAMTRGGGKAVSAS